VAVIRVLRNLQLPDDWRLGWFFRRGFEFCLFNGCSDHAWIRRGYLDWKSNPGWRASCSFEEYLKSEKKEVERSLRSAERCRQWRDASESGRIDIEIKDLRKYRSMLGSFGGTREAFDEHTRQIEALEARKAELIVSESANLHAGKHLGEQSTQSKVSVSHCLTLRDRETHNAPVGQEARQ
jgi:hypothetical protein